MYLTYISLMNTKRVLYLTLDGEVIGKDGPFSHPLRVGRGAGVARLRGLLNVRGPLDEGARTKNARMAIRLGVNGPDVYLEHTSGKNSSATQQGRAGDEWPCSRRRDFVSSLDDVHMYLIELFMRYRHYLMQATLSHGVNFPRLTKHHLTLGNRS